MPCVPSDADSKNRNMILINTTFSIDTNIREEFVRFLFDTYIPLAKACGAYNPLLTAIKMKPEPNIITGQPTVCLALQMRMPDSQALTGFRREALPRIHQAIGQSWGPAAGMFETEMDVIKSPEND